MFESNDIRQTFSSDCSAALGGAPPRGRSRLQSTAKCDACVLVRDVSPQRVGSDMRKLTLSCTLLLVELLPGVAVQQ